MDTKNTRGYARAGAINVWLVLLLLAGGAIWYFKYYRPRHATAAVETKRGEEMLDPLVEKEEPPPSAVERTFATGKSPVVQPAPQAAVQQPVVKHHKATTRAPTARPKAQKLETTCRACGGTGSLRSGSTVRTCPICHGTPRKIRWVSPDKKFCDACAGFGAVMEMRHGAYKPTTCSKCRGTGLR